MSNVSTRRLGRAERMHSCENVQPDGEYLLAIDCSGSMYGADPGQELSNLDLAVAAAIKFTANAKAEVIGFANDAFYIHSIADAKADEHGAGTNFTAMFLLANELNPRHLVIITDGETYADQGMLQAWRARNYPISIYHISSSHEKDDLMRSLCRGGGSYVSGSITEVASFMGQETGVKMTRDQPAPRPRSFRDRLPDIKNSLAHARTRAQLGGEIANLTGIVDNVAHDLNELAQNHNTTRSELDMLTQADASALEALQVLHQQRDANVHGRIADASRHTAMLERAGDGFGQLASDFLGAQLLTAAERTASAPGVAPRAAFQQRTLDSGLRTRAAVLLSAPSGPAATQALPPPSNPPSEGGALVPSNRRRPYGKS